MSAKLTGPADASSATEQSGVNVMLSGENLEPSHGVARSKRSRMAQGKLLQASVGRNR